MLHLKASEPQTLPYDVQFSIRHATIYHSLHKLIQVVKSHTCMGCYIAPLKCHNIIDIYKRILQYHNSYQQHIIIMTYIVQKHYNISKTFHPMLAILSLDINS